MVQRVLIPFFILVGFLVASHQVDSVKGYDFPYSTYCRIAPQGPAADILFIGSSRLRVSVSEVFMEEHGRQLTGQPVSVHMISSGSADLTLYNGIARQYLQEKGTPGHVFIEAMHTTRTDLEFYQKHKGRPLVPYISNVGLAFLPIEHYHEILTEPPFSGIQKSFNPGHLNTVEFAAKQRTAALYRFIKEPQISTTSQDQKCITLEPQEESQRTRQYLDMLNELQSQAPRLVTEELLASPRFTGNEDNVAPRSPASPQRNYETVSIRELVRLFREAGTGAISLVVLPAYGEPFLSAKDRATYTRLFPGAEMIFAEDLYETFPDMALMYEDRFHYNASGRARLSNRYLRSYVESYGESR